MSELRSFDLLGVRINAVPFEEALQTVLEAPDVGARLAVHFATAHSLVEAYSNERLRAALRLGIVEPDGMPLVWIGRHGGLAVERVCGPDFLPALIGRGVEHGRRHLFYGGAAGVAQRLAMQLQEQFPGLRVAGTLTPPFRALEPEEDRQIVEAINSARPDYVWVGLGAPKQDLWIADHRPLLDASALLAVGAAFDFHAGTRRRAPAWMQRTGTEWLYRLATEPRRLGTRYTLTNARFVQLVMEERLRRRP